MSPCVWGVDVRRVPWDCVGDLIALCCGEDKVAILQQVLYASVGFA